MTGPPRARKADSILQWARRLIDGIQEGLPTLSLAQLFDEVSVFVTLHLIYYQ